MKLCVSALVAAVLFLTVCASGQAMGVTVDGNYSVREWEGSEKVVIVKKGSATNCAVTYATMSMFTSAGESAVYFLLIADSPDASACVKHGAMLSVCGSEFVTMTAENSPLAYDIDNYNFRSSVSAVSSGSFACEVRVGFKHSIPNEIPLQIRLIDTTGEPSTVFFHTYATAQEESTTVTQATTTEKSSTASKDTTTVSYIVNTEPRKATTHKATTAKRKTISVKTTTAKTKTTKHITTKASTLAPALQAEYYEATTTSAQAVSVIELQTLPISAAASYTYSGEQTHKKKIIVVISSVGLIAVIAAFGILTPRKKSACAPQAGESKKED